MAPVTAVAAFFGIRPWTNYGVIAAHNRWQTRTEGFSIRHFDANISIAATVLIEAQVVDILVRPTLDWTLGRAWASSWNTCWRSCAPFILVSAVTGALYVVLWADYWAVVGAVANRLRKADVTHVATVRAERKWTGHEATRRAGDWADRRTV